MEVFLSAGEPSGDLHGANLVRELRRQDPTIKCVGYGGPKMAEAGMTLHEDLTAFAVMWFTRVISHIRRFWGFYKRAGAYFQTHRPDAVVLIDYPGFNWWIARAAKREGIPVVYYGPPQMWAWGGWRIKKIRRLVDFILSKLPFEEKWYRDRGCNVAYIGHPYFDELQGRQLDQSVVDRFSDAQRPLVTLLPGSRNQEVELHLPWFLSAAEEIQRKKPAARFAIASFNEKQGDMANAMLADATIEAEVLVGKTPELITAAHCCIACSGSVSLELMYNETPAVIGYRTSRLFHEVALRMVTVRYVTLVNLLASKDPLAKAGKPYDPNDPFEPIPMPEYPVVGDDPECLVREVSRWLDDKDHYRSTVEHLTQLKSEFGKPGATQRAADFILQNVLHQRRSKAA